MIMEFKNRQIDRPFIRTEAGDWHSRKDLILLSFCYAETISVYPEKYIIIDFDKSIDYFVFILAGIISDKITTAAISHGATQLRCIVGGGEGLQGWGRPPAWVFGRVRVGGM